MDKKEKYSRYFDTLRGENSQLSKEKLLFFLSTNGIVKTDPRIDDTLKKLNELDIEHPFMDLDKFIECIEPSIVLIDKVLSGQLIIPDFKDFTYSILDIYQKISKITDGHVADYIPQLARIDPNKCGISISTIDGQQYSIGDVNESFCSVLLCFNYALALEENGLDEVHHYVGREPSGEDSMLVLNKYNKPHNPLINSGAIMTSSLIQREAVPADRFDYVLNKWGELSGKVSKVSFSNPTYQKRRQRIEIML